VKTQWCRDAAGVLGLELTAPRQRTKTKMVCERLTQEKGRKKEKQTLERVICRSNLSFVKLQMNRGRFIGLYRPRTLIHQNLGGARGGVLGRRGPM